MARLVVADNAGDLASGFGTLDWYPPNQRTAEASPNGRYLAFASEARLTSYDNTGPTCHLINFGGREFGPGPCREAFLYDSATGKLTCASCNPSGEAAAGLHPRCGKIYGGRRLAPAALPDGRRPPLLRQPRLARPRRHQQGVEDVYEYEPQGAGTCTRAAGCTSLISAGTGADRLQLARRSTPAARTSSSTTRDQLTLRDKDELIDLYDAREGGGIAAETEVARAECQGEACQPPVARPQRPHPRLLDLRRGGQREGRSQGQEAQEEALQEAQEPQAKEGHKHKKKQAQKRAAKHNRGGAK